MSYDLFFRSAPDAPCITPEAFREHFRARKHYTVQDSQAWYANEDTGVYFSFDLPSEREAPDPDDPDAEEFVPEDASFNLNYYRPHVFGLEAEPEVAAFVSRFQPFIDDPQSHGMGEGPYSSEGFLKGWRHGNQFAHSAVLASGPLDAPPLTLPAATIERFWRWNLNRAALQERIGEAIFVPRVMFFASSGAPISFVVWTDGMAAFLPVVDSVMVVRAALGPRRFLRRRQDLALVPWSAVHAATVGYPEGGTDLVYRILEYPQCPAVIARWIGSLSPTKDMPKGIGLDQILDRETLDTAPAQAT